MHAHSMFFTHLSDKLYAVRHPLMRMAIRRRYSPAELLIERTHNVVLRLAHA